MQNKENNHVDTLIHNVSTEQKQWPDWLPKLLLLALILALLTVSIASYIRLVDSGLGCDNWPECYGQYDHKRRTQGINRWVDKEQPSSYHAAKIAHRLVASSLSCIVLFVFYLSRRPGFTKILSRTVSCSLLLLILMLASIGAIRPEQPVPLLILFNFIGGLSLVVLIYYLYLRVCGDNQKLPHTSLNSFIRVVSVILFLQVIWGGWTSANYAGASCQGFFACQTQTNRQKSIDASSGHFIAAFIPAGRLNLDHNNQVLIDEKQSAIQLFHHVLAVVALIASIVLVILVTHSARPLRRQLQSGCFTLLALLIAQFLLGLMSLALRQPLMMVVLHNLLSALLLISVTTLNVKISPRGSL